MKLFFEPQKKNNNYLTERVVKTMQPPTGFQWPQPGTQQQMPAGVLFPGQQKNKIVAGILGIFLGTFGIHNFYLGYTGKGIAQLLMTILSFGLLSPVTWLWSLIEAILILTDSNYLDARGIPLN